MRRVARRGDVDQRLDMEEARLRILGADRLDRCQRRAHQAPLGLPADVASDAVVALASVDHLKARKGAFRIALIPPEVLRSSDKKTVIPPLHGALLKNEQDVHLFERVVFMARAGR